MLSSTIINVVLLLNAISFLIWIYLWLWRGGFWQAQCKLKPKMAFVNKGSHWPTVSIIIPARNEAGILPITLPTILNQDYPGLHRVFLVNDNSNDRTAAVAAEIALEIDRDQRLSVIDLEPLPPDWTGKLWALEQGTKASMEFNPEFFLFTDADIHYPKDGLREIVKKAMNDQLDLVSLMVKLRVETMWERLLIPAFVYFFTMIYPFSWVNDPKRRIAAGAGGCMLVRRAAFNSAGGIVSIRNCIIDDCALAKRIKQHGSTPEGKIWLGLSERLKSIRGYHNLAGIWSMVARTAYTQLNYSLLFLFGAILGLILVFAIPPFCVGYGLVGIALNVTSIPFWWIALMALVSWFLMARTYGRLLSCYKVSWLWAPLLPLIAILYLLMTLHSAWQYLVKAGNSWKGRSYS